MKGDIVSYRVIPMVGVPGDLKPVESRASTWSAIRVLSAPPNSRFIPFFNRGLVMSQFMARYLERKKQTPAQFKASITKNNEEFIRTFLYGYLGPALFNELSSTAADGGEIFAALYELQDHRLIQLLCALGPRAHVVLGNGSIQHETGVPSAELRKRHQNREARKALIAAGVDVSAKHRFTSPGCVGAQQVHCPHRQEGKAGFGVDGKHELDTDGGYARS